MTTQASATTAVRGHAVEATSVPAGWLIGGPDPVATSRGQAPLVGARWIAVVTTVAAAVIGTATISIVAWVAGVGFTPAGWGYAVVALTGAAAAGLCLAAGYATGRDDLRGAWALLAIALVGWAASIDLAWATTSGSAWAGATAVLARLAYFAFFPLATIGILRLSGHRRAEPAHALVLDVASICIAVVAALYIFVAPWDQRPALVVPDLAFRAGDAIIVAALATTALRWPAGAPRGPVIALGAGFACLLAADLFGGIPAVSGAGTASVAAEALAALGMAGVAWGAALQVRSGPSQEQARGHDGISHGLVPLLPGAAVTIAVATLVATRPELLDAPITALLIGATALTVLAGARRALVPSYIDATGVDARPGGWAAGPASDIVVTVDRTGRVVTATAGMRRLTEYSTDETVGSPFLDRVDPADRKRVAWALGGNGRVGRSGHRMLEFRMLRRDFTPVEVEASLVDLGDDPATGGTELTIHDVAESHLYELDLRRQAFHDHLTGLANRAHFLDRVEHSLERCLRSGDGITILYMDLDGFKRINDSLGHGEGDRVLGIVGERLACCVRGGDMVARLGGDEFAVLLEDEATTSTATAVAERFQAAIATPIAVSGRHVRVGMSIGIASSATLGEAAVELAGDPVAVAALADELVRNADVAMYESKHGGKQGIATYEPAMRLATVARLDTETALREAVDERQFVVHYQPIVDLATGRIIGMEALARWRRPGVGLVAPSSFIAIAEETGLVRAMGAQLLRTACSTAARWASEGEFDLAVNLSPRQIADPLLVGIVARAIEETGLDPHRLVFEITESLLLDDGALTLERLGQLRAMGIRFAVDDFGTGYSSLSYLGQLPLDILKVDRSFVIDLASSPKRATLLRAIVAMAGALGLTTVAEGVETEQQLALVRELGCDCAQGFLLAGPADADEAIALIAQDVEVDGTFADLMRTIPLDAGRGGAPGRPSGRGVPPTRTHAQIRALRHGRPGPSYRPGRTVVG